MTYQIEESEDRIKGYVGDEFVASITLLKNRDTWAVGGSRCLPTSIDEARQVVDCMQAALARVHGPEEE